MQVPTLTMDGSIYSNKSQPQLSPINAVQTYCRQSSDGCEKHLSLHSQLMHGEPQNCCAGDYYNRSQTPPIRISSSGQYQGNCGQKVGDDMVMKDFGHPLLGYMPYMR